MEKINCSVCGSYCDEDVVDYCPDCISFICGECSEMYEGYCESCFDEISGNRE